MITRTFMTRFFKKITLNGVGAVVSALMLLCSACTEVDDRLGMDIVPPGERMDVMFATLQDGIESYLSYSDSISSSSLDYAYFGKLRSEGLGVTTAAALVQFGGGSRSDTIVYEERTSVPDSMLIICDLKVLGGDTLKEQTFNVYPLNVRLRRDSTYYNSFDFRSAIKNWDGKGGEVEPMFTFKYSGKPNSADYYDTLRLTKGHAAEQFMKSLWESSQELCDNDTLFINTFNGLCIVPAEESESDAAIYGLNLQYDATYGPESYLVLYGHDYLTADADKSVVDDILRIYPITNSTSYSKQKALSAFEHTYDAELNIEAKLNVDVPSDKPLREPQVQTWVQGVMGVTTTLEFGEEFLTALRALKPEGKNIFINQACLYVELADKDYLLYDSAPERLGSYLNYSLVQGVADYNYYYESSYDVTLNYGGMFNRTHGYYSMDLAIYMQQLLQGAEGIAPRVTLGMTAYEYLDPGVVKLAGASSTAPVRVEVTYTLLGD